MIKEQEKKGSVRNFSNFRAELLQLLEVFFVGCRYKRNMSTKWVKRLVFVFFSQKNFSRCWHDKSLSVFFCLVDFYVEFPWETNVFFSKKNPREVQRLHVLLEKHHSARVERGEQILVKLEADFQKVHHDIETEQMLGPGGVFVAFRGSWRPRFFFFLYRYIMPNFFKSVVLIWVMKQNTFEGATTFFW